MGGVKFVSRPVRTSADTTNLFAGHWWKVDDREMILLTNDVVGIWISERKRQHSLLLQIGLMDASERSGDDGNSISESRLHCRMLA